MSIIKNVIATLTAAAVMTAIGSTQVSQIAQAAVITVNNPDECIAVGGTPVGQRRCRLD